MLLLIPAELNIFQNMRDFQKFQVPKVRTCGEQIKAFQKP